jgi:hypothetical protein
MDMVVKLFSMAFEQICASKEVDEFVLEGFRIVFQAAKDCWPLLAYYGWKVEGQFEGLAAANVGVAGSRDAKKAS